MFQTALPVWFLAHITVLLLPTTILLLLVTTVNLLELCSNFLILQELYGFFRYLTHTAEHLFILCYIKFIIPSDIHCDISQITFALFTAGIQSI